MADAPIDPLFEQLQFDLEVAANAVDDTIALLTKAIAAAGQADMRSESLITEGVRDMNVAREALPAAIEKVAVARGAAKAAAYTASAAKAHGPEIVAAIKQIAGWEKKLLKLDTAAEQLTEQRFKAQEALWERSEEHARRVRAMTALWQGLADDQVSVREALDAILAKGERAVEQRNANALALAQADLDSLPIKRFVDGLAKLNTLAEQVSAGVAAIGRETRNDMASAFRMACKRRDVLAVDVAHFSAVRKAVKALALAPIDIARALKATGLPPSQKAALAKALAADEAARLKALDALGPQATPPQTGRALVMALRRARVL